MKSIRRILSTLLCVVIIASMCVPAFAIEGDPGVETHDAYVYWIEITINGVKHYAPSDVYVGYNYTTTGNYVALVQNALNNVNKYYPKAACGCEVDTIFGPETYSSVYKFQVWAGISADGIVGPSTWRAFATYCR